MKFECNGYILNIEGLGSNSCFGEEEVRDIYSLVIEGAEKYLRSIYDFNRVIE